MDRHLEDWRNAIEDTNRRRRVLLVIANVLLLAILSAALALLVASWFRHGRSGMWWKAEWGVDEVTKYGPASAAGIRRGDLVVSVNGIPVADAAKLAELDDSLRSGDVVRFEIARGEETLIVPILMESPLQRPSATIKLAFDYLALLVFLLLGAGVFWKKPGDTKALLFCLLCMATGPVGLEKSFSALRPGLGCAQGGLTFLAHASMEAVLWTGVLLFAPLLLHFCLIFPRPRPILRRHPRLTRWVYGLILFWFVTIWFYAAQAGVLLISPLIVQVLATAIWLAVLAAAGWSLAKRWRSERWHVLLSRPWTTLLCTFALASLAMWGGQASGLGVGPMSWLIFLSILAYPVAAIIALVRSFREGTIEERRQIAWPLWGIVIALVVFLGHTLIDAAFGLLALLGSLASNPVDSSWYPLVWGWLTVLSLLLIPLGMAIGIMKYRLMEIEIVIKKTLVYATLTGLILALYAVLAFGLGGLLTKLAGIRSQWVIVASTLVVSGVLLPLRRGVQSAVDRRFFRKKRDYPKALMALGREVHEASGLKPLLSRAAEILQQALQSRSVVIFTREGQGSDFKAAAKVGLPDEILGHLRFPSESRIFGMVRGVRAIRELTLSEEEKGVLKKIQGSYLLSLTSRGSLIGLLSLGAKLSDEELDEEDLDFLTSAADQLATGIHDLAMREQERDMERARDIQRDLLPKEIPAVAGFEIAARCQPAKVMAGDYFDLLGYTADALGICVADVVGKGLPAAMLMSNLQAGVRAIGSEDTPPHKLVEKVNNVIAGNVTGGKFITCFYGLLQADERKFSYCNAGQNPPLLLRKGGDVERLDAGGPALGIFPKEKYEQGEVVLSEGDVLLLYTDGVLEERSGAGEIFGEERLISAIREGLGGPVGELVEGLFATLRKYGTGDLEDDATLIILRAV